MMRTLIHTAGSSENQTRDLYLIRERFVREPIGLIMLVLGTFILAYGEVTTKTPFRIAFFEAWQGATFSGVEVIILLLLVLAIVRRVISHDYRMAPSRMSWPFILMAVLTALVPYLRMVADEGVWRIPFEANFMPFFVLMFIVWRLIFHPSDIRLMIWIILISVAYKSLEGIAIYLTADHYWGLLTGWRDGMLLAMAISGAIIAYVIRPDEHELWYRRVRVFLFAIMPAVILVFVLSLRRSYILALIAALPFIYSLMPRGERKRLFRIILAMSPFFIASVFLFGSTSFSSRIEGIANPTEEGSAAWRLVEYFNTVSMIVEKPIFGWPWGVSFINYTGLNLPNINSVIPHNSFLYVLLRSGIIGLCAWVWFQVRMVRISLNTVHVAPSPGFRFVSLWMLSMGIMLIVAGITMPVFASKLIILVPFCIVLTGYLPGATIPFAVGKRYSLARSPRNRQSLRL